MTDFHKKSATRTAWEALSPRERALILSGDELGRISAEREELLAQLVAECGPMRHDRPVVHPDWLVSRAAETEDYAMSLGEIGEELGLCRERVRQIIEGALTKMRRAFDRMAREDARAMARRPR